MFANHVLESRATIALLFQPTSANRHTVGCEERAWFVQRESGSISDDYIDGDTDP